MHLPWFDFFVTDGRVSTIYDGNARAAVQQVVADEDLSRYIGIARHGEDFVASHARLRRTRELNAYRGLLNEQALADRLAALGYLVIEPEFLPAEEQVRLFAAAGRIVAIGGAGLEYGLLIGREDLADSSLAHRRWTLDLHAAMPAVAAFMENR